MKSVIWVMALVAVFPCSSYAEDSMIVTTQLGALLAAEDACSMSYDKDAIQRYIEKKVAADDLNFASMLPLMVKGQQVQIEQMSDSSKSAFCIQQRRAAKKLGFVQ
ncbi:signal recognition particle [Rhizobium sp. LEGMi198b]